MWCVRDSVPDEARQRDGQRVGDEDEVIYQGGDVSEFEPVDRLSVQADAFSEPLLGEVSM